MIKTLFIVALLALPALAQTSNVETVKAWTRDPVMADLATGELRDTSGQIAEGQRLASIESALEASTNLVIASNTGLTNALAALYAVTNRVSEFNGRIYLAADMDEAEGNSNIWMSVGREWVEPDGSVHYWLYSNFTLETCPRTIWDFEVSPTQVIYAFGEVQNGGVAVTNVNGFAMYHVRVPRPSGVGNVVIRTNKHLKTGHATEPLDLSPSGMTIDGQELFTGTITEYSTPWIIRRTYSHGLLVSRREENEIQ
jgi:hypothetical protein